MNFIKENWFAFYILGLNIISALIKQLMFRKKKTPKEDVCCWGCKYLDYWNDGSALCTKDLQDVCIPNGFKYREVTK